MNRTPPDSRVVETFAALDALERATLSFVAQEPARETMLTLIHRLRGSLREQLATGWESEIEAIGLHNRVLHIEEALVGIVPGWTVPR